MMATLQATKIGRRLKPFTLGHQELLEFFDSIFAADFKLENFTPTVEGLKHLYSSLLLAGFICTHDITKARRKLSSRFAGVRLWWWAFRLGKIDAWQETAALLAFLKETRKEPFYHSLQKPEPGKSPFTFCEYLLSKLKSEFGKSDKEAEQTPYRTAVEDYCLLLESKGAIKLLPEEERGFEEWATSVEAQKALDEIAARLRAQDAARRGAA